MTEERHNTPNADRWMIPLCLVGLVALPFLLIGVALFEEQMFHTSNITDFYRNTGLFGPLDWLLDNTFGRLIDLHRAKNFS